MRGWESVSLRAVPVRESAPCAVVGDDGLVAGNLGLPAACAATERLLFHPLAAAAHSFLKGVGPTQCLRPVLGATGTLASTHAISMHLRTHERAR